MLFRSVGIASTMLLGYHGVRTLTVERHRGTAIHPRAAQISQRTMEILRTVGIEQEVMQASHGQFEQDGAVMAVESLAGKELAYFISNLNEGVRHASPCLRVFITQSLLEPLMRSKAESYGADLRYGTELVSFRQDADGVTAKIRNRDTGREEDVRARYMIACDGSHSSVREQLGISMQGRGVLSKSVTLYLRGNIAPLLRDRNLSVIYVLNSTLQGFFRFEKPYDRGFLAILSTGDRANPNMDVWEGLTEDRCREYVRAALGADIPVEIRSEEHTSELQSH